MPVTHMSAAEGCITGGGTGACTASRERTSAQSGRRCTTPPTATLVWRRTARRGLDICRWLEPITDSEWQRRRWRAEFTAVSWGTSLRRWFTDEARSFLLLNNELFWNSITLCFWGPSKPFFCMLPESNSSFWVIVCTHWANKWKTANGDLWCCVQLTSTGIEPKELMLMMMMMM